MVLPFFYGEMKMIEQCMEEWVKRLIFHEGMSLMPYYCPAGKLTIGVGRNLEDNPLTEEEKRALGDYMHGITENGAKMLLRNDIVACYAVLKKSVKMFDKLSADRQYALLDMCFQLGWKGLKKFKRMLKEIERENFDMAAFECLTSAYARQTPKRARRIARTIKFGYWSVADH